MVGSSIVKQSPPGLNILYNLLIRFFDIFSQKIFHWLGEAATTIYWTNAFLISANDSCFQTTPIIVFSKIWSLVDYACAGLGSHIPIIQNSKCSWKKKIIDKSL